MHLIYDTAAVLPLSGESFVLLQVLIVGYSIHPQNKHGLVYVQDQHF